MAAVSDPSFLIACIVWLAVYFHRIQSPDMASRFTTAARFRAALAAHVSLYLFVLLVFHLVLRRILLSLGSSAAEEYAPVCHLGLSGNHLVHTGSFSATTPVADRTVRRAAVCQKLAGQLGDSKLAPDSKWLDLGLLHARDRDINVHSNWFPPAASVRKLMLDSTALLSTSAGVGGSKALSPIILETRNDFDLLRRRFDRLTLRVSRSLTEMSAWRKCVTCSGQLMMMAESPCIADELMKRNRGRSDR